MKIKYIMKKKKKRGEKKLLHINCKLSNTPFPLEGPCYKALSSCLLSFCASGSQRISHEDEAFSVVINTDHIVLSPWLCTKLRVRLPWEYYLLKRQTVREHRRAVHKIESRRPLYFHGFSGVKTGDCNPFSFCSSGQSSAPRQCCNEGYRHIFYKTVLLLGKLAPWVKWIMNC